MPWACQDMNLPLDLNRYQRAALLAAAAVIVFVQFTQFSDDGVSGSGWILSFLAAGALVAVALAGEASSGPAPPRLPATAIRDTAELDAAHAALRENAEILAIEVEQRATIISGELLEKLHFDETTTALAPVMPGVVALSDTLKLNIHLYCLFLMLGLVGMRRGNGKRTYITGIEFKQLQERVLKKVMDMSVAVRVSMPIHGGDPQLLQKAMMNDLQQVRSTITRYCVAVESGQLEPEGALLDWFRSMTGLAAAGHPQVALALRGRDD